LGFNNEGKSTSRSTTARSRTTALRRRRRTASSSSRTAAPAVSRFRTAPSSATERRARSPRLAFRPTVSSGTQTVKVYRNTLQNHNVAVDVSTSTSGVLNFDITDNCGSGGTANNGTSNGKITGSDSVAVSVFTNANSAGSATGLIRGNTIGTQGVIGSGSRNGRGMQIQNEGSINIKALISGNIVQSVAGNQEINVQHGIAVAGAAGTTNARITSNILRHNTSTSRPLNVEILNTGALCADISGNSFSNNVGQGGGSSLLRVNRGASGGTFNVHQAQPTAAANLAELDDANGLSFPAGQVTVGGTVTFSQPTCAQP
jgi:hypothetical protein